VGGDRNRGPATGYFGVGSTRNLVAVRHQSIYAELRRIVSASLALVACELMCRGTGRDGLPSLASGGIGKLAARKIEENAG